MKLMLMISCVFALASQIYSDTTTVNKNKLSKKEYIEKLKDIALHISVGNERDGQSVRAERLWELVRIVGADNIAEILVAVTEDKYPDVRMAAADAMGSMKAINSDVLKALDKLLKDKHPGVRLSAASALNNLNSVNYDCITVTSDLALGSNDKNWDLSGYMPIPEFEKQLLAEKNGNCIKIDKKSGDCVLDMIRKNLRKKAITELSRNKNDRTKEVLKILMRDKDSDIRNIAKKELNNY